MQYWTTRIIRRHVPEVRVAFELNSEIPRKFLECHIRRLHRDLHHFTSITSTNSTRGPSQLDDFNEFRPITPRKCLRMKPRKCLRIFHLDYFDKFHPWPISNRWFRPTIPRKCLRMLAGTCLRIIRVCPILHGWLPRWYHVDTSLVWLFLAG